MSIEQKRGSARYRRSDVPEQTMDKQFAKFANATARITGSPPAFLICLLLVAVWALSGPLFKFSETWQLVINTGTTIITFLMVFLIQNTQNRDGLAVQTKLDELILSSEADNEFMGIEKLTDKELEVLRLRCEKAARRSAAVAAKAEAEKKSRDKARKAPVAAVQPRQRTTAGRKPAARKGKA
jgi:low affinity Fe/Cu permease